MTNKIEWIWGPCKDGYHSECMVEMKTIKCACKCGHAAQAEREVRLGD